MTDYRLLNTLTIDHTLLTADYYQPVVGGGGGSQPASQPSPLIGCGKATLFVVPRQENNPATKNVVGKKYKKFDTVK